MMRLLAALLVFVLSAPLAWSAGAMGGSGQSGGGSSGGVFGGSGGGSTGSSGGSDHGGYSQDSPPNNLTDAINSTWMCVRWMVVGVCYPTDLMVVTHYYPVAYITTPVKPDKGSSGSTSGSTGSGSQSSIGRMFGGGSSSTSGGGSGTGTGSSGSTNSGGGSSTGGLGSSTTLQTRYKDDSINRAMAWEAIVWQITDDERDDALESWDGCLCEYSESPSTGSSSGSSSSSDSSSGTCDSYDGDSSGSTGGAGGSGTSSSGSGSGSGGGGMGGSGGSGSDEREMYYNSARDGNNWREGCRDLTSSGSSSGGMGSGIGTTGGMPGSGRSYDLEACQSAMGMSGPSLNSQTFNENCLGSWGALYPRYTFTSGTTELISSMKIAYRAAHVASNTLGQLPHPVDKTGIMQQADPRQTFCFDIGTSPMMIDALAGVNQNGQYSWIYWRKFGCCKDISSCGGGG